MADPSRGPASFLTQVNALLRKDLTFQKRNMKTNLGLIAFPIIILLLFRGLQNLIDKEQAKEVTNCKRNAQGECEKRCSSPSDRSLECPIRHPKAWIPLVQVPYSDYRAVNTDGFNYPDLPSDSCRKTRSCPVSVLLTGDNKTLGQILADNMFPDVSKTNISGILKEYLAENKFPGRTDVSKTDNFSSLSDIVWGTTSLPQVPNYVDPGWTGGNLYAVQRECELQPDKEEALEGERLDYICVKGLSLWRNSSSEVNNELYRGDPRGNPFGKTNEMLAGYDLLNTNREVFNVSIWFDATQISTTGSNIPMLRTTRLVNLMSNAFLQYLLGSGTKMRFEYIQEMPKGETLDPSDSLDIASLAGPMFFTWIILLLFPVMLQSLVYEKQHKLRIMMKMHGLGDRAYWIITYAYFLLISSLYMFFFGMFGGILGLKYFKLTDYKVQVVFYFLYINLQIAMAFLVAAFFSNAKTATVVAYIAVFATGLMAQFLVTRAVQDIKASRHHIILIQLYPGFALYHGLYEFGQSIQYDDGMQWKDFSNSENGMRGLMLLMFVEWLVLLVIAFCLDQFVSSSWSGKFFFLLRKFQKKAPSSIQMPTQGSNVLVHIEKPDVIQEREKVNQFLLEPSSDYSIICDDLKKVYPGRDGNPAKFAVRGLSLAVSKGECFGMLGPNGAGKTSFISMMIGLSKPTSGTAYVEGLDIQTDMPTIYTSMGVCPQFDLLWETLTGREHLLFYARLKNLKGTALTEAVEASLKSVNLFNGGHADRQAGKYSGGMKRRLSAAISLIGDPKVVYMDEPSTGLDPASRKNLWNIVKRAKEDRAIILTTHSMEEAEVLCDRVGIFVDGNLQCIGYTMELKRRYAGSYVFTMTSSSDHEHDVENLVRSVCPSAKKVYHVSGTQKFEMPKNQVKIAHVFAAVQKAKEKFDVAAWGLADTTLEDVFIKVARV